MHIIHSAPAAAVADWREQLRTVISDGASLLRELDLHPEQVGLSEAACRDFPLKVPRAFVRRMRRGDPQDPLLRQVLASAGELAQAPGFGPDPTGEVGGANPRAGIIHKYRGRLLLVVASGCAVNCRYCFRRHFPYADNRNSRREWQQALDYVREDSSISEVILSGGDPLVAEDDHLAALCADIAAIAHVKRLRIHSRLPIVLPDRVTPALLDALNPPGLQSVMVVHCNHANELDDAVAQAFRRIRERDMTLLNQAVLLAGVNDSEDALAELSEALFERGALPYYLHLLDRVQGAAHFEVDEQRAQRLHAAITARLPGYLVPRLVREIAGEPAKSGIPPLPPLA
ncbi:EF-P beta-lysylation protein EpmB [Parahaliea aestuarii]|uniref:L-lysine 2,3-aminomutase n=1 Tax=Parahaliea aestuarii TaxID=1852021 RepID=A0A5C8ZL43_9GAMM|nr:EF-P beta-lysylation protein EpmB [Parahaliea aestuarii]TXS89306.1 EF-P beta-lysylation protein EpmB [Parahaliea aestuarii]